MIGEVIAGAIGFSGQVKSLCKGGLTSKRVGWPLGAAVLRRLDAKSQRIDWIHFVTTRLDDAKNHFIDDFMAGSLFITTGRARPNT